MMFSAHRRRPLVIWTLAAHRHLQQALAALSAANAFSPTHEKQLMADLLSRLRRLFRWQKSQAASTAIENTMSDLTGRLERIFPKATAIVVQEQYTGFSRRDDEFILLVEIAGTDHPGRHVVKLAPPERLEIELQAWESCRPEGLHKDLVFMTLEPCQYAGRLIGLIYDDAQQFLGVPVVSLERAVRDAVSKRGPSLSSVADTFNQLYERIGHLLYGYCYAVNPIDADFVLDVPRLGQSLDAWTRPETDHARVRRDVNTWASSARGEFRDPVDYLQFVCECVPWRGDAKGRDPRPIHRPERTAGDPPAQRLVPSMLYGRSHGDLHGRNVLVGIVRDRARWPAVFDYEKMGPANLLAWDFVRMETELKVRIYRDLFANERAEAFIRSLQDFEIKLAEPTEACYNGVRWPEVDDPAEPVERLRQLLLALRRQAALHLGSDRGRPRLWLDEYYFALACYGVHAGRFASFDRPELLGLYVSAGVAAARLLWAREDWFATAAMEGQ
jgi:hypothetical protein